MWHSKEQIIFKTKWEFK